MNRFLQVSAFVIIFLCYSDATSEDSPFPVEFKGIVPEYRSARVVSKKNTRDSTTVQFAAEKRGRAILSFYHHAMVEKGWIAKDSIWDGTSDLGSIKFKKKNKILFLMVHRKDEAEKTIFTIRLDVVGGRD